MTPKRHYAAAIFSVKFFNKPFNLHIKTFSMRMYKKMSNLFEDFMQISKKKV
jgi:hypothetical protein